METKKLRVYCASGWFTPRSVEILENLERILEANSNVDLYSPRRDGIMLPPDQKHDTALRESIFKENISQITKCDLVVANVDCGDRFNDPGTVYEVGYAMSNNIPVIGLDMSGKLKERFESILSGFESIASTFEELRAQIEVFRSAVTPRTSKNKVLFVGADNKEVNSKLVSVIMESGANVRWIDELSHPNIYSRIDEIFSGVEYMIAVIDDRKPIVSWMIGQAYSRGIPIVTYSDFNYGVNVMLLCSLVTHLRGESELTSFLQQVKREGLDSIPPFDISTMNAM